MTRDGRGDTRPPEGAVRACQQVIDMAALLRSLALRRSSVVVDVEARLRGDPQALLAILSAIFDDARRHGATRLALRVHCHDGRGCIAVADNRGCAQPADSAVFWQPMLGPLWPADPPADGTPWANPPGSGRVVKFVFGEAEPAPPAHALIVDA